MALLLCGFGGFLVPQIIKGIFRQNLPAQVKLWLAILASFGISALLFAPNRPRELVIYGAAGAGLAVLVHRSARLASIAGDLGIRTIFFLRTRR